MTFARRILCVVAVCLSGTAFSFTASAQQIDQDAKTATGPLNAEQLASVRDFVEPWMAKLVSGDPESVTDARDAVLREFRAPGITTSFRDTFSEEVSRLMPEAIGSEDNLVRINAMIVATQLTNPEAVQFIDRGLSDDNAAVQYWSAKAYLQRVDRAVGEDGPGMPGAEQRAVIAKVQQLFANDPSTPVARVGFEILSKLDDAGARAALLDLLHDRVAFHADNTQASYLPEQTAIQLLSGEISRERRSDPQEVARLAHAAYRYFVLIHGQLAGDNVLERSVGGHKAMMDWCHKCLQAMSVRAEVTAPADSGVVNDNIIRGRWDDLAEAAEAWKQVLADSPFNIPADELE